MITKGFLASRMFVGIVAAVMTMTVLSSCSERDDPSPSDPSTDIADYAVLLYGHGSASPSLDFYIIKNIHDCYMADPASYDKVKVAVQYKWTTVKALKTLCKQVHYASGDIDDFDVTPEEIAFAESHMKKEHDKFWDKSRMAKATAPTGTSPTVLPATGQLPEV